MSEGEGRVFLQGLSSETYGTPLRCVILRRSDFKAVIYAEDIAVKLLYTMAQRLRAEITPEHD